MHLDLTDEETLALLNLLVEAIEADRYPFSPRIRLSDSVTVRPNAHGVHPSLKVGNGKLAR